MGPGIIRMNCLRRQPLIDLFPPDKIIFEDLSPSV